MGDTVVDISVAELRQLLDGGDEDDWLNIVRARVELGEDGKRVRVRWQNTAGEQVGDDLIVSAGAAVTVTWTLRVNA